MRHAKVLLLVCMLMAFVAFPVHAADVTVSAAKHAQLGTILTGPNGMTLYVFTKDDPGVSNCYDACAVNWPPLLVKDGEQPVLQSGLSGSLGTATRQDGALQVTYDSQPLYYWIGDRAPGDTNGQNVGGVWFVVNVEPRVEVMEHPELGPILVGANQMSLYVFTRDAFGVSNCYDACEVNWPPLLVKEGEKPALQTGVSGSLGTTTRKDGTLQVTYNGMPLYYWIRDKVAGDVTGHLVGGNWFVAQAGLRLDLAGHWSQAQVTAAVRSGWVTGHPDGSFKPEDQVTRAELVKMLTGAFGVQPGSGSSFTDTAGHWASGVIEAAVAAGIIKPGEYDSGRFEPDRALTRGEVAAMVVRALGQEADAALSVSAVERFADGSQVAAEFRGFLGLAVAKRIMNGYEDNTLRAGGLVTRAEAVVMIQRALSSK